MLGESECQAGFEDHPVNRTLSSSVFTTYDSMDIPCKLRLLPLNECKKFCKIPGFQKIHLDLLQTVTVKCTCIYI